MIQDILLKWGIPTYAYNVQTVLQGQINEKIGDTLEVTVGWVYGLSVSVDGVFPDNSASNITSAQVMNLYLTLKYGQSLYVNKLRLDHLTFSNAPTALASNVQATNPQKYLPVNIPVGTDLKQSFYNNPLLIKGVLPAQIGVCLNLFYIDIAAYNFLLDQKLVIQNGLGYMNRQGNK